MKSELSFLMDLFLSEEVPTPIKKLVADRIREVEEHLVARPALVSAQSLVGMPIAPSAAPVMAQQAPSMQRIMERHPDVPIAPPTPVTPAAAMALQQRQEMIDKAINGKKESRGVNK